MNTKQSEDILHFIRSLYPNEIPVPLHAPRFWGNEKRYLAECIDTTYVSYVGKFVTDFEDHCKRLIGANYAIAMVNGTAALQLMLLAAGIRPGEEIVTQALTFAATAAGIKHAGAEPAFVDVDRDTFGMSPESLRSYLSNADRRSDGLFSRQSGRKIVAAMPMHTFGHPSRIMEVAAVCEEFGIQLFEDAAESLGSYVMDRHTGTFGRAAVLSFNGNKPVTTGGGGMIVTNDEELAAKARHLSTTAKRPHRWEFFHDEVGFNLRLPNINAALGCAQMERFDLIIENKRKTAILYQNYFRSVNVSFHSELEGMRSNYWLNAIILADRAERDDFLQYSNDNGVQTRPIWTLMSKLPPYRACPRTTLTEAEWLEDRIVNIPSSIRF